MIPIDTRTTIRALAGKALACRLRGEYREAEALYVNALEMAEQALEETDPQLASLSNDVAVLYKYTRFDAARRLYLRALKIFKRCSKAEPLTLAMAYHNIGGLEHARGRYKRAEAFARRSVVIREKAIGPNHPATAADLAALAAILEGQQRYDEAERLYRRSLAIFERAFGPDHYEIAVNLNNLATLSHSTGRRDEAEKLYRRALAMKEKLLGLEHPDVAITLNNMAALYRSENRLDEAASLYARSLTIFKRVLDPDHPNLVACAANYGRLLADRQINATSEYPARPRPPVIRLTAGTIRETRSPAGVPSGIRNAACFS